MIWVHLPGKQGKWSMSVRDIFVGVDGGKGVSDPKISNCSHSVEECQYIWNMTSCRASSRLTHIVQ